MSPRKTDRWVSYTVAAIVLALVAGGIATAAKKPASGQRVTGCYAKKNGALRILTRGKRCKRGERKIVWTRSGTRGARGPRGLSGSDGANGPRGATGAAGAVGPRGATGPQGSTGSTGPVGPSNSFEAFNAGPISITATDASSANSLATLAGLAPGSYALTARVQLNGPATTASRVVCTTSLGSKSSTAISDIGTGAGNVVHDVPTFAFNATLASTGTGNIKCHRDTLTGTEPTATEVYLELTKVDSATSTTVGS